MTTAELRDTLIASFQDAVRSVRLDDAVATALTHTTIDPIVHVLSVGKAAPIMFAGASRALGGRVRDALLVTTRQTLPSYLPANLPVRFAGHPLPDENSLAAADEALAFARRAPSSATLLVLVSGGASSLWCAPPEGMSLQDKIDVHTALLRSGASIREINTVRRHLSRIKGGRLALACRRDVLCMVVSDVIGGRPHDVGSGPACPTPTNRDNALAVLERYIGADPAERLRESLGDGLPAESADTARVRATIVSDPETLASEVSRSLGSRGFSTDASVIAESTAQQLVRRLDAIAQEIGPGHATIIACEPTLTLDDRPGRGGRAGWTALNLLVDATLPHDVAVLCAASDGVDGSSGAGGACVSGDLKRRLHREIALTALAERNDASIHERLGTHLRGEPTGINLTDVYVVARCA